MWPVLESNDMRGGFEFFLADDARTMQEQCDRIERQRLRSLFPAASRRMCGCNPLWLVVPELLADAKARLAIDVGQVDHVARIDQVRVLDLPVRLPDFRP
jgi:hypothetical protein